MYTIVMDKYKNLNTTVRAVLYQQENMADQIQFLLPPTYEGSDLTEYIVTLKYVDPNGNFHSEVLKADAEKYKEYIRYTLPVTTKFTRVSGDITVRLTLVKFNPQDDTMEIDRIETSSTSIRINRPVGFVDNVDFEDIEAFKAQMNQMSKDVNNLQDNMPNDLEIGEGENLHLVHDDTQIGDGVEIAVPHMFDELDDSKDGIIDVDNLKPEPTPTPSEIFIEL